MCWLSLASGRRQQRSLRRRCTSKRRPSGLGIRRPKVTSARCWRLHRPLHQRGGCPIRRRPSRAWQRFCWDKASSGKRRKCCGKSCWPGRRSSARHIPTRWLPGMTSQSRSSRAAIMRRRSYLCVGRWRPSRRHWAKGTPMCCARRLPWRPRSRPRAATRERRSWRGRCWRGGGRGSARSIMLCWKQSARLHTRWCYKPSSCRERRFCVRPSPPSGAHLGSGIRTLPRR
mmetsp:Transcript_15085/g.41487  ORF Transcript_15085/g.41487 Transcript_15085/m.41487 type:complete len:229 (-) Transcript_15085:489-1175(-)